MMARKITRSFDTTVNHHFVVRYWREPQNIDNPTEVWRGKVSQILQPLETERGIKGMRIAFHDLQELPAIIRSMIEQAPENRARDHH